MTYRGHLVGALVVYAFIVYILGLGSMPVVNHFYWLVAILTGALFPDIDIYSKGQRLFLKLGLLLLIICILLKAYIPLVFVLVFSLLAVFAKHRTWFHNFEFIFTISALIAAVLIYFTPERSQLIGSTWAFFLMGALSHLVLDRGVKRTFFNG